MTNETDSSGTLIYTQSDIPDTWMTYDSDNLLIEVEVPFEYRIEYDEDK